MNETESIFGKLATKSALLDAWKMIQQKGKTGGIDGVSVKFYSEHFDSNINALLESLKSQRYIPEPYARISTPKDGKPGEYRHLSLPTINDKIVQQALRNQIEPLFNKIFKDISYAYRPQKGPARAIQRISHILSQNRIKWVTCADIDLFFDSMDHKLLLAEIKKEIDEPEVTKLVSMWLKTGVVTQKGIYQDNFSGVAQGGIISPLFSNIYLHPLDSYMIEKKCLYVRYADNLILLSPDRSRAEKEFQDMVYFLENVLKLKLNRQREYILKVENGFTFMGIFFRGERRYIDRSRIDRMEKRIRFLVRSKLLYDEKFFFTRLKQKTEGFDNYYAKLVPPESYAESFNRFLQQSIVENLVYSFRNSGNRLTKTDIKALLLPIELFGNIASSQKDKWIVEVADQCVEKYREIENKKSAEAAPEGVAPAPPWKTDDKKIDDKYALSEPHLAGSFS